MSEKQPPTVVEGAAGGDFEDEVDTTANKSAEDRKAASALAKLDHKDDDAAPAKEVDQEAVNQAMKSLAGGAKPAPKKEVKNVKVDPKDVALLVDELELNKVKATELLKAHDGKVVEAMQAYVRSGLTGLTPR